MEHDAAVRELLEHLSGEHAVAAADVEHPHLGVALERQQLDEPPENGLALGVAGDVGGDPLFDVVGGVPVVVAVRVG